MTHQCWMNDVEHKAVYRMARRCRIFAEDLERRVKRLRQHETMKVLIIKLADDMDMLEDLLNPDLRLYESIHKAIGEIKTLGRKKGRTP